MAVSVLSCVTEDATLDAFDSSDAAESDEDAESSDSDADGVAKAESADETAENVRADEIATTAEADTDAKPPEESEVKPIRSTYEWSRDGGECADCGASANRRWRRNGQTEGDLVCVDCKEW